MLHLSQFECLFISIVHNLHRYIYIFFEFNFRWIVKNIIITVVWNTDMCMAIYNLSVWRLSTTNFVFSIQYFNTLTKKTNIGRVYYIFGYTIATGITIIHRNICEIIRNSILSIKSNNAVVYLPPGQIVRGKRTVNIGKQNKNSTSVIKHFYLTP